ncbi:integrating conjugative element protein [Pectobacterium punjabense]|uniref:Integrating conjugative element protein n=1 Tax=Pectobacterium punjabense TaxID=2108399 RepID=A0ABX6KYY8_9GAMM|nr:MULTISPECIES: integrating conjugative element protein [Pectobacterium]MBA0211938.1 integrating conjugative element protein [Pectobacterium brasiliense]MBS4430979.1 integrating conjugative element protein [Pectobacterium punjabense]PTA65546.1 integrating conjugative element protein [Pectobacterium punjabense]QJA19290.1 integrating conjugative element protein [Pectobacterium punjabense]
MNTLRPFVLSIIFSGIFLLPSFVSAELTVVADLGGESTDAYFEAINPQTDPNFSGSTLSLDLPSPVSGTGLTIASVLPVTTPELTPGKVAPRALKLTGMPPIFIIGDDPLSRDWLVKRAGELQRLKATGFVVSVSSETSLRELQMLLPGNDIAPVSGSDLAKRLQLSHYPVLITENGLSQ